MVPAGARTLFADCDLRSIEAPLAANGKVRVFANENDFLLRPEDVAWLRATLGGRARLFPSGGHVGNLHRVEIRDVITMGLAETSGVPRVPLAAEDEALRIRIGERRRGKD